MEQNRLLRPYFLAAFTSTAAAAVTVASNFPFVFLIKMASYIAKVQFYKCDFPIFKLNSHFIEDTIIPGANGALLTHLGEHHRVKETDDIRHLSDDEILKQYEKITVGKFCEVRFVCHPTNETIINPIAEVRNVFNFLHR